MQCLLILKQRERGRQRNDRATAIKHAVKGSTAHLITLLLLYLETIPGRKKGRTNGKKRI